MKTEYDASEEYEVCVRFATLYTKLYGRKYNISLVQL
jgi:hypothetical protein